MWQGRAPKVQAELDVEIDRMLCLGVIEECRDSAWNSLVTLVKKAKSKVRLCLNARKVNKGLRATVTDIEKNL